MAELDGNDDQELEAGADGQTAEDPDGQTDSTDATPDDQLDPTGDVDRNDPNYKYWQAAYTKTRMRDREQQSKVMEEYQNYKQVLSSFYTDNAYALQVLRQRFPELASQLTLNGTPANGAGTRQPTANGGSGLVEELEHELGESLAFLAPKLGPVLERAITAAIGQAVRPIQEQTAAEQRRARQREQEEAEAELDGQSPGWETRFKPQMSELEQFLASGAIRHPKFGTRQALLLKLVNPDLARIDAAREMGARPRGRVGTGRSGPPAHTNVEDQVRKAPSDAEAFRLAAEAAAAELTRR